MSPREEIVELGGEKLVVEMPYSSVDDTNGGVLDVGLTYEGMLRELRALESLAVGDVIWEVDPKEKVISTRWVSNAKTERIDGQEHHLVRCRVVARVTSRREPPLLSWVFPQLPVPQKLSGPLSAMLALRRET